MKKSNLLLTICLVFLAFHVNAQTCNTSGTIIQGVECKLVFANNTIMHPCEAPPEYALLNVGDTFQFSFEPSGCVSFCQQGMDIKITCLEPTGGCQPTDLGVLKQGNSPSCKLLQLFSGSIYHVCNAPQGFEIFSVGDTIGVKYALSNGCFSPCNEGQPIEVLCFKAEKEVQAYFTGAMGNASFLFTDLSQGDSIHTWSWTFGDGGTSTEQHATHFYPTPGWYEVCLTVTGTDTQGQLLTDTYCDQIYINDGCVDSSQICVPGSLCCDAPLFEPVCGCNGVTYDNACVAAYFGGVLSSTPGACASSTKSLEYFQSLELLPNPTSGATFISTELPQDVEVSIHITNLAGQAVKETFRLTLPAGAQRTLLDVHTLPTGMYLVHISTGDVVVAKKLVVER